MWSVTAPKIAQFVRGVALLEQPHLPTKHTHHHHHHQETSRKSDPYWHSREVYFGWFQWLLTESSRASERKCWSGNEWDMDFILKKLQHSREKCEQMFYMRLNDTKKGATEGLKEGKFGSERWFHGRIGIWAGLWKMGSVLLCVAAITKYPRRGGVRIRNVFSHSSRGQERGQGVGRVYFFWGASPWSADGCLSHSAFTRLFLYLCCLCPNLLFLWGH